MNQEDKNRSKKYELFWELDLLDKKSMYNKNVTKMNNEHSKLQKIVIGKECDKNDKTPSSIIVLARLNQQKSAPR